MLLSKGGGGMRNTYTISVEKLLLQRQSFKNKILLKQILHEMTMKVYTGKVQVTVLCEYDFGHSGSMILTNFVK
jgi:hypothetical protein